MPYMTTRQAQAFRYNETMHACLQKIVLAVIGWYAILITGVSARPDFSELPDFAAPIVDLMVKTQVNLTPPWASILGEYKSLAKYQHPFDPSQLTLQDILKVTGQLEITTGKPQSRNLYVYYRGQMTLRELATQYYPDPAQWTQIYWANKALFNRIVNTNEVLLELPGISLTEPKLQMGVYTRRPARAWLALDHQVVLESNNMAQYAPKRWMQDLAITQADDALFILAWHLQQVIQAYKSGDHVTISKTGSRYSLYYNSQLVFNCDAVLFGLTDDELTRHMQTLNRVLETVLAAKLKAGEHPSDT